MKRALALTCIIWASLAIATEPDAPAPQWAIAVLPSGTEFRLEIAATPEQQIRGYMFREYVGPREGMLFLFEGPGWHTMWMKNCRVALDLVWLDAEYRVIDIAHEQQPCPARGECPSIGPMTTSRYVLELAAGVARQQNLKPGDPLIIISDRSLR